MNNNDNDIDIAVSTSALSKYYDIYRSPLHRLFGTVLGIKPKNRFLALNDITIDIRKGEAFAIVGKNGSGKSTLLQILAGIIKPSGGSFAINGKVAALLELGSGFDTEATGYENIRLCGAVFGLGAAEIDRKIQNIIAFADIGEYLYQPVKTYSSGMFVRLAFSVAIHVDADVLLVDEALAVGDIFFRQKCYAKLYEMRKKGVTIILVTHNMSEVEQFCNRALLLQEGKCYDIGDTSRIVKEYLAVNELNDCNALLSEHTHTSDDIELKNDNTESSLISPDKEKLLVYKDFGQIRYGLFSDDNMQANSFHIGDKATFVIDVSFKFPICGTVSFSIVIKDQRNTIIHGRDTVQMGVVSPRRIGISEKLKCRLEMKLDIAEGEYTYDIGVASLPDTIDFEHLTIEDRDKFMTRLCNVVNAGEFVVTKPHRTVCGDDSFHGLCELNEKAEIIWV